MAKTKLIDCYSCGETFVGKKLKSLCKRCALIRLYKSNNEKGVRNQKVYTYCVNCLDEKTASTAAYCSTCYSPVSDKLWKFNKFKVENKIRNELVIRKVDREGITPLNAYIVCDAWLYITRYDSKWLTKSTIEQVKLMVEELKEYNQELYTKEWWDEETKRVKALKKKNKPDTSDLRHDLNVGDM